MCMSFTLTREISDLLMCTEFFLSFGALAFASSTHIVLLLLSSRDKASQSYDIQQLFFPPIDWETLCSVDEIHRDWYNSEIIFRVWKLKLTLGTSNKSVYCLWSWWANYGGLLLPLSDFKWLVNSLKGMILSIINLIVIKNDRYLIICQNYYI